MVSKKSLIPSVSQEYMLHKKERKESGAKLAGKTREDEQGHILGSKASDLW